MSLCGTSHKIVWAQNRSQNDQESVSKSVFEAFYVFQTQKNSEKVRKMKLPYSKHPQATYKLLQFAEADRMLPACALVSGAGATAVNCTNGRGLCYKRKL